MSRIMQFAVLVMALLSLSAVVSSTAGAVTWHNTGNTSFTATGGTATVQSANATIHCNDVRATGASLLVTLENDIATGTATFTSCSIPSLVSSGVHMACNYTLTGISATATVVTGTADFHCVATIPFFPSCTITGSAASTYTNPTASATGRLHRAHSSTVTVSGSGCLLSQGQATLSAQTLTITSATGGTGTLGPKFTRTA
jgi:hypothetical protein